MNDVHEVRAREIETRRDVFQAIADPTRRADFKFANKEVVRLTHPVLIVRTFLFPD